MTNLQQQIKEALDSEETKYQCGCRFSNAPTWLQQLLDEIDRQHDEFYNEVRIGHQELEKAQKEIERLQKESNENYQFGQTHMRRADRLSLELTAARNNSNWANTRIEELELLVEMTSEKAATSTLSQPDDAE